MSAAANLEAENDGLACPEVGSWAKDKYRLIALCDELFSSGMKNKWNRLYIDLYAGAGYGRIKGTSTVLKGSPVLALTVPSPFDKYIFARRTLLSLTLFGSEHIELLLWLMSLLLLVTASLKSNRYVVAYESTPSTNRCYRFALLTHSISVSNST